MIVVIYRTPVFSYCLTLKTWRIEILQLAPVGSTLEPRNTTTNTPTQQPTQQLQFWLVVQLHDLKMQCYDTQSLEN